MKETFEFRINYDYAYLLFGQGEGKDLGTSVKVIELTKNNPRFNQIPLVAKRVKAEHDKGFYFSWRVKRKYTKKELEVAKLLHILIKTTFEPAGEECGTIYDESTACELCGANRKQVGPLKLKLGSIPAKDISKTIAGEVVVSKKFVEKFGARNFKGVSFNPIFFESGISNYYQLKVYSEIELSKDTFAGIDPYDFSESSDAKEFTITKGHYINLDKEIYKCPKGHTIGLNLLSEPYVLNSSTIKNFNIFTTSQKIGVTRGLLRPESLYLCLPGIRKMVQEEKLSGFDFEIAHLQ